MDADAMQAGVTAARPAEDRTRLAGDGAAAAGRPAPRAAEPADGFGDLAYSLGDGASVRIHGGPGRWRYELQEPQVRPEDLDGLRRLREQVSAEAARQGARSPDGTLRDAILGILRRLLPGADLQRDPAARRILQDMAGYGPLDALLRDRNLEDIHVVGTTPVHVVHRTYGMIPTNVRFTDPLDLMRFLRLLCERIGRPVSDATPIVDAVLPDGSRLNLVYSGDVSLRGPTLSIRRATEKPLSITRLLQWGTLSPEAAAYLWMCLEHGLSMFFCGEAACGKTTTLNAALPFIDPRSKIYSAEDTPEVRPPHRIWQRLLTRETGPEAGHVRMFDLLKAALRSRPDYIVVGEIRGAEGAVAFQAMQTGHPTIATFHATDPTSLVQRLGSPPIGIPLNFMDNLNVAVFQEARVIGGRRRRRVTRIVEIAGVTPEGLVTIPVFEYDRVGDRLVFQGRNNSHVLERKIAPLLGMEDTRRIYGLMERRAMALQAMADLGITEPGEVNALVADYARRGEAALPFRLGAGP